MITLLGTETLERGDTTTSDMEVFPLRSHPRNTWKRVFIALTSLLEESLEAKILLNLLQNGKWLFKCTGPQKTQGKEEKSTYTKVQSLNTRWHWQVSSNRAEQHHPSHHQNKNLITEISALITCRTRADRLHWNKHSSQDSTLFLCPSVAACVAQHVTPKAEHCPNYTPTQEVHQNKKSFGFFLRLMDVFQEQ